MSPTPRFSIITICLNEVDGIEATCQSLISQSLPDREWLVIDGGSTDGTLEVLAKHAAHITRLVSEPDGGIYDAMNKGIAMARGDYLLFMNGGDRFASGNVLARVAQAPRVDLIYGDIRLGSAEGPLWKSPARLERGLLLKRSLPHQASFYQRGLFDRFGLYDTSYRIAGDYEFFARLVETGDISHHHIPEALAIFDPSGMSRDPAYRDLRKRENHRVRMRYFRSYRWTPKAWRQAFREQWRERIARPPA